MVQLARWQRTIVDATGVPVGSAQITVRLEISGTPLAALFSDREGTSPISNPFTVGDAGFAAFYAAGGAYSIRAKKDAFEILWRHVAIGRAAEFDPEALGRFSWRSEPWAVAQTYLEGQAREHNGNAWICTVGHVAAATNEPGAGATYASFWSLMAIGPGVSAGLHFKFDAATAMADPGAGDVRFNNATLSSVTAIAISDLSAAVGNPDVSAAVLAWDDATNATRGTLIIKKRSAPENFRVYNITGATTDNSGWSQLAVAHVGGNGSFAAGDALSIEFTRSGDSAVDPGIRFRFDDATAMADPGTGDARFNNATLSSVTAIALSDLSSLTGNPDVSAAVLAWDDSTNAVRGTLLVKKRSAPENFRVYNINGASTDNSGWTQLAVAHVAGNGSFANGDELTFEFCRAGDAGAAGSSGHGQCVLVKDGTDLRLKPLDGNKLIINGTPESVPDAGVALSPSGLAASTDYYVYAYMSAGTMTLEASATAPAATAGTGVMVKTGDGTRSLVGQARTNGSTAWVDTAAQRFVRSWFNDPGIHNSNQFATSRSTTSTTFVEINSEIRIEALLWSGETWQLFQACAGLGNGTVNSNSFSSIGVDGTTPEPNGILMTIPNVSGLGGLSCGASCAARKTGLSRGSHYATVLGKCDTGTASWSSSADGHRTMLFGFAQRVA